MKPENRMLSRLKPKLERDLGWYIEKTNNAYRGGRPDWDIFGSNGFCGFIEAKFWDKQARRGDLVEAQLIIDRCSALQQQWLFDRAETFHAVGVLCGFASRDCYAFVWIDDCVSHPTHVPVVSYDELTKILLAWANNEQEETS